jgi:hypothetical protein
MKHEFPRITILKSMKIVKYFHKPYKAGALLSEDIKKSYRRGVVGWVKRILQDMLDDSVQLSKIDLKMRKFITQYS